MDSQKRFLPLFFDYALISIGAVIQAIALRMFLVPAKSRKRRREWNIAAHQSLHSLADWADGIDWEYSVVHSRLAFSGRIALCVSHRVRSCGLFFFVDLIPRLNFFPAEGITDDIFLNSLYGAVVSGVGYGLVYRARGTSGGSDVLARILNHYRSVPMTQSYLIVDSAVILAAGFVFGWKQALYAIITLYVSGLVSETILEGPGMVRTALIVTNQPDAVVQRVLVDMERGMTILQGKGAYTGAERPVLYCVINRSEVSQLKAILQEVDPKAFMVIGQAHEAVGEGFKPLIK